MRAPWEHRISPLARAFDDAMNRASAATGDAEVGELVGSAKARLLVGLDDVDLDELNIYLEALSAAYIAEIAEQATDDAGDAHAVFLVRGLATVTWLAGRLQAARVPEASSAGSTLAEPSSAGSTLAEDPMRWLSLVLELERERAAKLARAMEGHPIAELFDGVARELADYEP